MVNTIVRTIWLIPVFLLCAGSVVAQQTDVVELQDGSTRSGVVQGYSVSQYVFKTNQGNVQVPRERVINIRYWDVTKPLGRLEKAFQNRRYERAAQFGETVRQQIDNGDLRTIHLPRVLYFLATSHFRQGNLDRAVELAKEGLQEPGHLWFDRLVRIRLLGRTFQVYNPEEEVTGDAYESISELGNELITVAKENTNASEETVDYIRLLRLQALEELGEGKLPITRVRYENMQELSDPVLEQRRFLGQRRSLIRQRKNLQQVVNDFEERLQQDNGTGSTVLQSGKAFAEGVQQFQQWLEQEDDSGLAQGAISSLVSSQVIYDTGSERYTIQHRQTLLHTMELYQEIAKRSSNESRKTFFSTQAQNVHDELVARYPGSPEARKASTFIEN
jgi:hypothetical protein